MSPLNIKQFDPGLALIVSSLGNGRVNIKINNSVFLQKDSSSIAYLVL